MASNFYRKKDSSRYYLGHGLELGFIVVGIIAAGILVLGYRRANHKRRAQMSEGRGDVSTAAELSALGDKAMTFRYMY